MGTIESYYGVIMQLVQTELGNGNRRMITLLPRDKRVKIGSIISLDKDTDRWQVLSQSEPIESGDIKRGWNNNI